MRVVVDHLVLKVGLWEREHRGEAVLRGEGLAEERRAAPAAHHAMELRPKRCVPKAPLWERGGKPAAGPRYGATTTRQKARGSVSRPGCSSTRVIVHSPGAAVWVASVVQSVRLPEPFAW